MSKKLKMRLTQKKIEDILVEILGEEALSLIRYLSGRENVSEFDLANKTKKDIKIVRKMLYILYNNNLVSFNRKKDKLKGWYIYYWTLVPESIKYLYFKKKKERLAFLKTRLEEETKELFFVCKSRCIRLTFDQAMDIEFHCPECGELIAQDNTEQSVADIKNEIFGIEQDLVDLEKAKSQAKRAKPSVKGEKAKRKSSKKRTSPKKKRSKEAGKKK